MLKESLVSLRPVTHEFGERQIMERRDLIKIIMIDQGKKIIRYRQPGRETWLDQAECDKILKAIADGDIREELSRHFRTKILYS